MGGLIAISLLYVALNAVSIWQRVDFYLNSSRTVSDEQIGDFNSLGILVDDPQKFPDIFVAPEDIEMEKIYAENYQNNYIYLPSLAIEAPIVYLNAVDETTLQSELKKGVGHYPQTALPGEKGNVFIFGHSSYYWWDWSSYSAVFANLENIKIGDKILVYYNDHLFIYRVRETKIVAPTEMSVLDQNDNYELTLMTCTPLGTSLNRFIVVSELVN